MPTLAIPYAWQDNGFGIVYETLELSIEFSGLIALVGDIDDLYNPANRLFLGLRFNAYWAFGYMSSGQFFPGANTTSARYVMRLSSGDLSCPLNSDYATLSGDIVHTATEWFPYSTKAGLPAWDAATGLPINGGPSA